MDGRRVVVTGMGVVSAVGLGVDEFWAALFAPSKVGKTREIEDWDPGPWFDGPKDARRADHEGDEEQAEKCGRDGDQGFPPGQEQMP